MAEATKENNTTYAIGSAIKISKIPVVQTINNKTLKIDFGLVNSSAAPKSNINSSSVKMKIWFQVGNDPVNLSGRKAAFIFIAGNTNLNAPIQVIGPILRPDLTIQKHAQVWEYITCMLFRTSKTSVRCLINYSKIAITWTAPMVNFPCPKHLKFIFDTRDTCF